MACESCQRLTEELLTAQRAAKDARASAALHFVARRRAEEALTSTTRDGVALAIRWVRTMPRRELVHGGIRIGVQVYQHVADSVARYIEDRLETSDQPTVRRLPSSPPDPDSEP